MKRLALAFLLSLSALGCSRNELEGMPGPNDGGTADGATNPDVTPVEPASNGLAVQTCGPTDGPAWAVAITESPIACSAINGPTPPGITTSFLFLSALSGNVNGTSYAVGTAVYVGRCDGATMVCATGSSGSVQIERFTAGSEVVVSWNVTLSDGSTSQSRARITNFCPRIGMCG